MTRLRMELRAEMEDGRALDVVADQRDVARWEVQPFGCAMSEWDSRINLATRFLAWSALTRQGELAGQTWDQFNADCVEVGDMPAPDDADDADDQAADADPPGRPGPSEASLSRSRGARARRSPGPAA